MQLLYLQLQNLSSPKKKRNQTKKSMMITKAPTHLIVHTYIHSLTDIVFLFPSLSSLAPHKANRQLSSQICQIRIKMGVLQIFRADLMSSCSLQKVFLFGNNKLWMLVTCPNEKKRKPTTFIQQEFCFTYQVQKSRVPA
jgi:hypothetical protein